MNKLLFTSLIIILLFAACGPSRKATDRKSNSLFNEWLHQPKSQLVNQWGQPDSIMSDGKNGEILIYKEHTDYISVMNENYTGPQYSYRKEMYVNADSLIYFWKAWRRK